MATGLYRGVEELKHICTNCRYRRTETHTTFDWGFEEVFHNFCGLDRKYMETYFSRGNDVHFSIPCDYFEEK